MSSEFDPYLDFWLEGQRQGFAGKLPRIKLPNGSKVLTLYQHPLLYVDNWFGSDLGGGQTILYIVSEQWKQDNPLQIVGKPVARLGYSGQIVRKFDPEDLEHERESNEDEFRNLSESEIIWKVLKSALSQVTRERPFRGPACYEYPESDLRYESREVGDLIRTIGKESVGFPWDDPIFEGSYDFTLIKNNFEDHLIA